MRELNREADHTRHLQQKTTREGETKFKRSLKE